MSEPTLNVSGRRTDGSGNTRDPFFKVAIAALCAAGAMVILLGVWLLSVGGVPKVEQRSDRFTGDGFLQFLVCGNLVICLFWVWLDQFTIRFCHRNSETREYLFVVMLVLAFASTVTCLAAAGVRGDMEVVPVAMFIGLPVLAVVVPLLWSAVDRMSSLWSGALVLTGFTVASGVAQERATAAADSDDAMRLFVMNSHLIGLAVGIWLLSWATRPHVERTA